MYKLEVFKNGGALITNAAVQYCSTFNAVSIEEAEQIVIGLNQKDMQQSLANYRLAFETAGVEVAGGLRVLSDRESQAQLANSYITLKSGLIPDTDWKAANGWQVGGLAEIELIAKTMAAHVRACFRGERATAMAINAAITMEQIESIDIPVQFTAAYEAAFAEVMNIEQAPE